MTKEATYETLVAILDKKFSIFIWQLRQFRYVKEEDTFSMLFSCIWVTLIEYAYETYSCSMRYDTQNVGTLVTEQKTIVLYVDRAVCIGQT